MENSLEDAKGYLLMKKIALLADGWRRYVIYSWVEGIMGGSKELGLDVCLYFYNTNGTWSQDSKFNKGEYALNDLPDLNSFDGVEIGRASCRERV